MPLLGYGVYGKNCILTYISNINHAQNFSLTEFTEQETKVFEFIDKLRESGETNMFGASPYIAREFPLLAKDASTLLAKWMNTFEERHPEGD